METMTRSVESSVGTGQLLMAFELGQRWWHVGFTVGLGQRPRTRRIAAGAVQIVLSEVAHAKARFGLPVEAAVISCYEAGREGFWLHRCLTAARGHQSCGRLVEHRSGSAGAAHEDGSHRSRWAVESAGAVCRGRPPLLAGGPRAQRRGRRCAAAASHTGDAPGRSDAADQSAESDAGDAGNSPHVSVGIFSCRWIKTSVPDGSPLPPGARQRLAHDWAVLQAVEQQLRGRWRPLARHSPDRSDDGDGPGRARLADAARDRGQWRVGVGDGNLRVAGDPKCAATRCPGWRVPALYQSGDTQRRGITRAGNHPRAADDGAIGVGLAPLATDERLDVSGTNAALRTAGRRMRRIGIVALARKLLVALWRYVDQGVVPDGAVLKS